MISRRTFALALLIAAPSASIAQPPAQSTARPPSIPKSGPVPLEPNVEKKLQADFKAPAGFSVTLFAGPPVAMYPTCVAESPDGAVYVCVDPNLSLSTLKGVGRVMRLVDSDGDGRADTYTVFAEMDSPRGVVSDGKTVYVMRPPFLTAYRDTNGDGISDESTDIVTGLGFDLDFRGADHTTNNIQLGPDGWLYVAVGDYGFMKAVGTDGRQIQQRGGSVVRVRPDGTHLEVVAIGTRNIYDVAVNPFGHLFSRDNTNDGDGWDTRLHYLPTGANVGYPTLYKNFKTEHFPFLHDYGAGSGVGGVWLQDPTWPVGFGNTLYTGDWTLQKIFRHTLTPKGASYGIQQDEFISVLRPADITVDARSNMYVASLAGGQFTYNSDTVGYVVQVRTNGSAPTRPASAFTANDAALLEMLGAPNAVQRLHAQQELLRRGANDATVRSLRQTVGDERKGTDARVSAMFTLKQLVGGGANDALAQAAGSADARVRETALRAIADRTDQLQGVTSALFVKALKDTDAHVQVQAIRGLARLGARDAAAALVPLAGSSDQALSHLAVNALAELHASDAALKGLDGSPEVRAGALRALALMHDPASVSALVARLGRTSDAPTRAALLRTLARLHSREGYWRGDWWTTKPAFAGPYFDPAPWEESPRIRTSLITAVTNARGEELASLVADLAMNQALPRGAQPLLTAVPVGDPLRGELIDAMVGRVRLDAQSLAIAAKLDAKGPALHAAVAQLLAGESALGPAALSLARSTVLDNTLEPRLRAPLMSSISQMQGPAALGVATEVFARANPVPAAPAAPGATPTSPGAGGGASADPVEGAWRRFVGDRRRFAELDHFINLAKTAEPAQRTLAFAVLVQSIRTPRTPAPVREKVAPVIEAAWADPVSAASLVQAISIMRVETQYTEKLAAYNQAKPK